LAHGEFQMPGQIRNVANMTRQRMSGNFWIWLMETHILELLGDRAKVGIVEFEGRKRSMAPR
jgi:hypothetical protein